MKNIVIIKYCPKCNWLMRAAWMGQELMQTFQEELSAVTLEKGEVGQFSIFANTTEVWNRKIDKGFPELKTAKQRVRDSIAPNKSLGHSDVKS